MGAFPDCSARSTSDIGTNGECVRFDVNGKGMEKIPRLLHAFLIP